MRTHGWRGAEGIPLLEKEGSGVWPFLPRRRRERTIAGGTRAFFSAYHRNNEAHENRTLNRVRGFLAPCWSADSYWNHHPGVTLAALANPRLISRHASGVAKTAKLQSRALARVRDA